MKTLSIIIPAYDAHATLPAALSSIVMQDIRDDIIVYIIDDYSKTPYDDIVTSFKPFLDIRLIRLDHNEGPAIARQIALDEITTSYVTCLDADDVFVSQRHLGLMIKQLEENSADLITGDFYEFSKDGDILEHINDDIWFFGKIYKKKLIDKYDMRIPIVSQNEDVAFNALYRIYCSKILHYNNIVYLWNYQPNSITRKNNSRYTIICYEGLVENLITIYNSIKKDEVDEERILHHLANRMIRFYGLAIEYYNNEGQEVLIGYLSKMRRFYDIILKNYEDKITNEIYAYEWQFIPNKQYPIFGFREFLKSLKTGEISI